MTAFRKPGEFPLRPQTKSAQGTKRKSSGVIATKTYGKGRPCAACEAALSEYNPGDTCQSCVSAARPVWVHVECGKTPTACDCPESARRPLRLRLNRHPNGVLAIQQGPA